MSNPFFPDAPADYVYRDEQNRVTGRKQVQKGNIIVDGYMPKPKTEKTENVRTVPVKFYGNTTPPVQDPGWRKPVPAKPEQQKQVLTEGEKITTKMDEQQTKSNNAKKALAVVGFLIDVSNANNAYQAAKGQAQLNIIQARNEAADAISRGHQAQLDRQSEGHQAGQDATLAMVAQGQDARGGAVSKIRGSYEAMGYMNGAREMINSYREALGYELEEVAYEYQIDQAAINRDNAILASGINTATTLAVM